MHSDDDAPTLGVGREDHHERREARADRLRNRAAKRATEAAAGFRRADVIARGIPMGQPVLVGHHSERRHRRDLERIDRGMRTGVEKTREAEELARRADAAERNTAISADDPDAIAKLQAKLAELEAERVRIKKISADARKGDAVALAICERACAGMHDHRRGMPAYVLTNLGANIRRIKERIAMLQAQAKRVARAGEAGVWEYREDPDTNRTQVRRTDGQRCTASQRSELKRHGFRWAPSEGAWQRQISNGAWYWAEHLAQRFAAEGDA